MTGMHITVLFVPFDAALQHYKRNAERGVMGYTMEQHPDRPVGDHQKTSGDEIVESKGTPIDFKKKRQTLNDQDAALTCVLESAYDQAQSVRPYTWSHPDIGSDADIGRSQPAFDKFVKRKMAELFPDILFLSEQPKGLGFPPTLRLTREITTPVTYQLLGTAGTLPTQRIFGYIRDDLRGSWDARELIKSSSGQDEKVLVVSRTLSNEQISIAGVHLTSKNTGIATGGAAYDKVIQDLRTFCKSSKIDVAIGDFNLDVRSAVGAPSMGGVGSLPESIIYIVKRVPAPIGAVWKEQYSNSANDKHYMG
jgi:hypothetical protein